MAEAGRNDLVVLPYFLGPSQAVTGYLPERVEKLRTTMPGLRVRLGPVLAEATSDAEEQLAGVLEDRVRDVLARAGLPQAAVAVVDHGSPEPRVAAVRDSVATRLRHRLGGTAVAVEPCSMERREGPEYAFADPLLSALLGRPPFDRGDVVAAMMFLSPGRHAGPDGDVAQICQEAQNRLPDLRVTMTDLLGGHPAILELLAASFTTAIASKSL
jgi:sirohydrochlorin ferrochelatase